MEQEMEIGDRRCLLFGSDRPEALLVQTLGEHERPVIRHEAEMIAEAAQTPFVMAAFSISDWERELTPWPDAAVSRREEVGRQAGETLRYVISTLLPSLHGRYGAQPVILGGYSLGGLFSLWASSEADSFTAIAAASPSLWIRQWPAYAAAHPVRAQHVYLSLGDREEFVRNQAIATVGDRVREEHRLLQSQLGEDRCTLEWNPGNHFRDGDRRLARGFVWCLRQLAAQQPQHPTEPQIATKR